MGKKISVVLLIIINFCFATEALGKVIYLKGEAVIERNGQTFQPKLSSRVYKDDLVSSAANSIVRIETFNNLLYELQPNSSVVIVSNKQLRTISGEVAVANIPVENSKTKSVYQALWLTTLYPGLGHHYLGNNTKAWPMFIASGTLLYNGNLNANLSAEDSTKYQQVYLAYLVLSLLDVVAETNHYNANIIDSNQLALSLLRLEF